MLALWQPQHNNYYTNTTIASSSLAHIYTCHIMPYLRVTPPDNVCHCALYIHVLSSSAVRRWCK